MTFGESRPDGSAPHLDHSISLRAGRTSQNISDTHAATRCWKRKKWPRPSCARQHHVRPLHFPSSETFVDAKMKPDQGKCQLDRLVPKCCGLRCKGIHSMLMDERRALVRQRVEAKLVKSFKLSGHCWRALEQPNA